MKNIVYILAAYFLVTLSVQAQECGSFKPAPGDYYISAWVKEVDPNGEQQISYTNSSLGIGFGAFTIYTFTPTGRIIDGWQRIVGKFEVPDTATTIEIKLQATNGNVDCYFDDIRVVPFNGNMKSFVYDPETQRLVAELDENNYATIYEYDKEGGLVRVKKETEAGISTIQETRSGNSKLNGN